MAKITIVTDTVASIPENLLESLKIHTVAYYIHRGQEVFRDLVNMTRDDFFPWMEKGKEFPKTASPGPGDYLNMYSKLAAEGSQEIISIHMTSKGSGAFQAARAALSMAAEKMPNIRIEVIDTLNVSMCQGWIALEAAREAINGKSLPEILQLIKDLILKTKMIQTADTLKYLYMGGRIGKAKHLVGTLLNIKPLISMEDGVITPLGQARSRKKAYEMIANLVEEIAQGNRIKVAYVHAAAAAEVEQLKFEIERRVATIESLVTELSPALSVHTGPGTVGICFYPVN